jgi:hypothetical protein
MEKEYDFSKGQRGKFYRSGTHLNLPIYLDDDVAELLEKYASKKKSDVQTVVNELLRRDKELKAA